MSDQSAADIALPREHTSHDARPIRLLDVRGASKRYGPVQALADVSLSLAPGEVHALVGENGSGKSTLVGIVSGTVTRDTGDVEIAGSALAGGRPSESQHLGAVTVFQDGSLIKELSVARNLYLGTPAARRPKYGNIDSWAEQMLAEFGFEVDVTLPASALPPGDRQLVEIFRAVAAEPRVLILDEATSALDSSGVDIVIDLMRRVADRGSSVLFVTHRLSEVMRVADQVTVLRDGQYQGTYSGADVTPKRLVEIMAGTQVDMEFPERLADPGAGALVMTASGLNGVGMGPVDVELRAGQIVGIAGADGNGQLLLLRALAKIGECGGSVRVGDREINNYPQAIGAGVVYLSSDRRNESLFAGLSVGDNLGIGVLDQLSDAGLMKIRRERSFVSEAIDRYRIRVGNPGQMPSELSGGNQQKVALSRVLAMEPNVVLVDEPTQGVDVRSRMDIYRFLRAIADTGSCVVVVSSDASELGGLCDRILVMSRGRVTTELPGVGATEESIVGAFAVEHELAADPAAAEVGLATEELAQASDDRPRRAAWRSKFSADGVRLLALVGLMALLAMFAQSQNSTFFSEFSLYNVLLVAVPLVAVSAAQYFVLAVGGIDVSVGSVMTLTIVLMSFWAQSGGSGSVLLTGAGVVILCALGIGGANALLVEKFALSPVIATIATLGIASGIALMLRPTAEGMISPALADVFSLGRLGPVPWSLIGLLVFIVLLDSFLRRTSFGLALRAVGLNGGYASRLGIATVRTRVLCYLACAGMASVAGLLLAAQVGIGDPTAGNSFTLLAIAAPVLGGAALTGGRGSVLGAAVGAFILVLAQSLVSVLGLSDGTSYVFAGGLTLLALMSSEESIARLMKLVRSRRAAI